MFRRGLLMGAAGITAGMFVTAAFWVGDSMSRWTEDELKLIGSLSLSRLPPLAPDPSNLVADDPTATALGKALFSDTRLSSNGQVSCASCHLPDRQFQDDLPRGKGVGETERRTMPIAGTAYSPWLFWDGRKDSQWSQALGPLESSVEHGADRTQIARLVVANYPKQYEAVFGPIPDVTGLPAHAAPAGSPETAAAWDALPERDRTAVNRVFANVGKAIAAFERTIEPTPTRFDRYAQGLASGELSADDELTEEERLGLKLFIGKGSCINCHNGPLFTDNHFHNTGVPAADGFANDLGRAPAVRQVREDTFNCLGPYSDASAADCAELKFMTIEGEELIGAFKVPSLRGVAGRPPYMHAGQLASLSEVLDHYNRAPSAAAGHSELKPMVLTEDELAALEAFLKTIDTELLDSR